ncbi:MAG: PriCT-2 domain-containing protein [candidate division Zixibacteria bacterium]|nr:PriCT-2 domain-containing protein [candidate division Zixibacteria bacterium]
MSNNLTFTSWFWGSSPGCFRCMWPIAKDDIDAVKLEGTFTDCNDSLQSYNEAGYGVFFVPNQGGHGDNDINRLNAFYLDIDAEKGQTLPQSWHVEPTVITKRGENYHVYWLLNPTSDSKVWRNIQERLVSLYNADKAVKNPSRVMRLPGFKHTKSGSDGVGYEVVATYSNRYDVEALTVGLPELPVIEINNTPRPPRDPNNYYDSLEYGIDCLNHIDPDSEYQDWLNVIAAFGHQYGSDADVVKALDEWSARSEHKYVGTNEIIKKLNSFNRGDTGGLIVKFGTVVDMAKTGGMVPREVANTDKRASALALMASTFDPAMLDKVVTVRDKSASRVAIDLSWKIKNAMESIMNRFELPDTVKSPDVTVNPDVIERIITRSFWSGTKSKLFVLTDQNTINMYSSDEMFGLLQEHFGRVWISDDVTKGCKLIDEFATADLTYKQLTKEVIATGKQTLIFHLKMVNQRERLDMQVDMFAAKPRMNWSPEKVTAVMVWDKLTAPDVEPAKNVIDDYKSHFPMVGDILDQIVASRFASNRKNFYIWLQCDSDWGKGLFTGILAELGILTELSVRECEKAFDGEPLARDASEFTRAFILLFDEFKNVKSELKQLEDTLPISPKNQLRQTVQLFTKLFTSADGVESLAGENGVEDQFANRFSYAKGSGSIKKRELFNSIGRSVYAKHLKNWLGNEINRRVNEYVSMGKYAATCNADNFGDGFHERYGIDKQFDRLSASVPRLSENFKEWAISNHTVGFEGAMGNCVRAGGGNYYLKSVGKLFGDWVGDSLSRSEMATVSKNKSNILKAMCVDGDGVKSHRINGSVVRSIKFKLEIGNTNY